MIDVSLDDFIGQPKILERIKIAVTAAKMRGDVLGHVLLSGVEGSGKRALATAIVKEMGSEATVISINKYKKILDFVSLLTNISDGNFLIIEDIDQIKQDFVDLLCDAMENGEVEVTIGKGSADRTFTLPLPRFTLIGIAEEKFNLSKKLLQCFYIDEKLGKYSEDELFQLAKRMCSSIETEITDEAAKKIAIYAEGSNKLLTNAIKRARDYATVFNNDIIDLNIVDKIILNLSDKDVI